MTHVTCCYAHDQQMLLCPQAADAVTSMVRREVQAKASTVVLRCEQGNKQRQACEIDR